MRFSGRDGSLSSQNKVKTATQEVQTVHLQQYPTNRGGFKKFEIVLNFKKITKIVPYLWT